MQNGQIVTYTIIFLLSAFRDIAMAFILILVSMLLVMIALMCVMFIMMEALEEEIS
jgi:putative ABC transport system permease protein